METLRRDRAEIIVTLTGLDETLAQTIHARHTFAAESIRWGFRFADILLTGKHGRRVIDFNRFHTIHPISPDRQLTSGNGFISEALTDPVNRVPVDETLN